MAPQDAEKVLQELRTNREMTMPKGKYKRGDEHKSLIGSGAKNAWADPVKRALRVERLRATHKKRKEKLLQDLNELEVLRRLLSEKLNEGIKFTDTPKPGEAYSSMPEGLKRFMGKSDD